MIGRLGGSQLDGPLQGLHCLLLSPQRQVALSQQVVMAGLFRFQACSSLEFSQSLLVPLQPLQHLCSPPSQEGILRSLFQGLSQVLGCLLIPTEQCLRQPSLSVEEGWFPTS